MPLDAIIQELRLPPSVQPYAASLYFDISSDDGTGSPLRASSDEQRRRHADDHLQDGYGTSLSKSEWWIDWIESRAGVRLTCLGGRARDGHHDVIAGQKTGWE
jgi:hypothetical protein